MTKKERLPGGLAPLEEGQFPLARRINRVPRVVGQCHTEIKAAKNPPAALLGKDPRTIKSYRQTLADCRAAWDQLGEIIQVLAEALGERDSHD